MARIVVVGAGVVGQSYAALLGSAGHELVMVARGERAERLRRAGLGVLIDGARVVAPCDVVATATDVAADAVLLAVRGEQFVSVLDQAAVSSAPLVISLTNPLGAMGRAAEVIGAGRLVWGFSGLGGGPRDGVVHAHVVRQQLTVVQSDAPGSVAARHLLEATGLPVDNEPHMTDWFATHNVFIAGMAAAILAHPDGAAHVAGSRAEAARLVTAMREGFDVLEDQGVQVRPKPLRVIFGRVPTFLAASYWKRQFATPMVTVSMQPHAVATKDTEMAAVFDHALTLVGDRAPRYSALINTAR